MGQSERPSGPAGGAVARAGARWTRALVAQCALSLAVGSSVGVSPRKAQAQLRYDVEYPAIPYATGVPTDPVARLMARLTAEEARLTSTGPHGYLLSVLDELGIPVSSQILVFSDTSLQTGLISAAAPRAIYFGDEAYVAWVQETELIEIATMDPELGPVFYTLPQDPGATFQRETHTCLECHDSFGLTGGGVPRFLVGSGLTDGRGRSAVHGSWILTTDQTPIERRWGGWYVTGTHGSQRHLGNLVIRDTAEARNPNLSAGANRLDLAGLVDVRPYPTPHSDIVALLVFEHQIRVQNAMTRASWEVRSVLREAGLPTDAAGDAAGDADAVPPETLARIDSLAEPLVEALLFVGTAPLRAPVRGTSGFGEIFEGLGPRDPAGRTLRDLELETRVFRYPVSYQIHTRAFDALPPSLVAAVYRRLASALSGEDRDPRFSHITGASGAVALEILRETKPGFAGVAPSGIDPAPGRP